MQDWTRIVGEALDPVWLMRTLFGAVAVALMWRVYVTLLRVFGWDTRGEVAHPAEWNGSEVVRVWTLDALRKARVIAPGTRVAIVDRGVVQFELPAGRRPADLLPTLLARYAIGPSARALQFSAAVVDVHHAVTGLTGADGERFDAVIHLHVGVDAKQVQRVLDSSPIRDGVFSVAEVQALVEDGARAWLEARLLGLAGAAIASQVSPMAHDLNDLLEARLFRTHGLMGSVRSLTVQRAAEGAANVNPAPDAASSVGGG